MKREAYQAGPAADAVVNKEGERWTLVIERKLRHPPEKVWQALTDPEQLREWAPFDANRNLGSQGPVSLSTVGAPNEHISESEVTCAIAPTRLEYSWGGNAMRWELERTSEGTTLTLWHAINKNFIAMGAAGWQICFDVLDYFLGDTPLGRIVAADAMAFGWPRLHAEYAARFGVEMPNWGPKG